MSADLIRALVMGLIQGLTEFLPISSSGHLVILPALLDWEPPSLTFAVTVHMGTLLALLLVYGRDMGRMAQSVWRTLRRRRLADYAARDGLYIMAASVPAAVAGFLLQPHIEALLDRPQVAAAGLCGTGLLLGGSEWLARWRGRERYIEEMSLGQALIMGLAQALALVPGISRSGATMAAGRGQGLNREGVARFSFLLGVPVMLGAGMWELATLEAPLGQGPSQAGLFLLVGFVASALSGMVAIKLLLRFVRRRSLYLFAWYCAAAGIAALTFLP